MEKLYQHLPEELVTFILVTVFSLLIGLSLRRISLKREGETPSSVLTVHLLLSVFWVISSIFSIRWTTGFLWAAELS